MDPAPKPPPDLSPCKGRGVGGASLARPKAKGKGKDEGKATDTAADDSSNEEYEVFNTPGLPSTASAREVAEWAAASEVRAAEAEEEWEWVGQEGGSWQQEDGPWQSQEEQGSRQPVAKRPRGESAGASIP